MNVLISIDIPNARKVLKLSSGSIEEANLYDEMTDLEIKNKVIRHIKCWAIREIESPETNE